MNRICAISVSAMPPAEDFAASSGVCPVKQVRDFLLEIRKRSCGHGVMCRDGLAQLYSIADDAMRGRGREDDESLIREICEVILVCSECELSVEAAKRVLASVNAHAREWELHTARKQCSMLSCYYTMHISPSGCTGCTECISACPRGAIAGAHGMIHVIDQSYCDLCGKCVSACNVSAINKAGAIKPQCPETPIPVGSFTGATEGGLRRKRKFIIENNDLQ